VSRGFPGRGRRFAFPRQCRLLRRAEFDAVYRAGRRASSRQFVIFFAPKPAGDAGPQATRFGLSVKRALGSAVVRNRIRRRIREILRLHRRELSPGWDVVIHPRSSVATLPFAALERELVGLLANAIGRLWS
jgi:ribonuclease P protein component